MYSLIIVTGQTATGKTARALEYAKTFNGELINCDSRQLYKKLDIVTGKDTHLFRDSGIPIWLYDIVDPKEYFSSFDFKEIALHAVQDVIKRGKVPIIVGGTYLYIKHLLYDVDTERIPPDWDLRNTLNKAPLSELQKELLQTNRTMFEKLNNSDKNNPQRLIRKIEIARHKPHKTGRKGESLITKFKKSFLFEGIKYGDKEQLIKAITQRVLQRIKDGAIEEVQSLIDEGYVATDPGLKTIGYQQIMKYLKNQLPKDKAIDEWIIREVQYAKRQLTFMKTDQNIQWVTI